MVIIIIIAIVVVVVIFQIYLFLPHPQSWRWQPRWRKKINCLTGIKSNTSDTTSDFPEKEPVTILASSFKQPLFLKTKLSGWGQSVSYAWSPRLCWQHFNWFSHQKPSWSFDLILNNQRQFLNIYHRIFFSFF